MSKKEVKTLTRDIHDYGNGITGKGPWVEPEKKSIRGGSREGAGRPPANGETKTISFRISKKLYKSVKKKHPSDLNHLVVTFFQSLVGE